MHATDALFIIDDDIPIITGAEPEMAFRSYTRRHLLALCRKAYLDCSLQPHNQQNLSVQEHIFDCWQYLKTGHRFVILPEDPRTGAGVDNGGHLWVSIRTSTEKEMRCDGMVRYELFFIPTPKTPARSKRNPDTHV